MKLRVSEIPSEGMEIDANPTEAAWFATLLKEAFREDYQTDADGFIRLSILKTCDNVSLRGVVECKIHPTCDRCLEVFTALKSVPIEMDLAPSSKTDTESEEEPEDVDFAFYEGDTIDLGDLIREVLVLSIPIKYCCREDCRGICPHCGQNRNEKDCGCNTSRGGSRFVVLKDLLK